jgi:hypothetical protein
MLICCEFFSDSFRSQTEEVQEQFKFSNPPTLFFKGGKSYWFSKTTDKERQVDIALNLALYNRAPVASLFLQAPSKQDMTVADDE